MFFPSTHPYPLQVSPLPLDLVGRRDLEFAEARDEMHGSSRIDISAHILQ